MIPVVSGGLLRKLHPQLAGASWLPGVRGIVTLIVIGLADEPGFVRREVEVLTTLIGIHQILKHPLQEPVSLGICRTHLEGDFRELPELGATTRKDRSVLVRSNTRSVRSDAAPKR